MTKSRLLTVIFIIFAALLPLVANIQLIPNPNLVVLSWVLIGSVQIVLFFCLILLLRPLNPGKVVMAVTWGGFITQIFSMLITLLLFSSGGSNISNSITLADIFMTTSYPFAAVATAGLCGREGRSLGAFFATLSGLLWIFNFFLLLTYVLPVTLVIAGLTLTGQPRDIRWIGRLRPPTKAIRIITLVSFACIFTIPYFTLHSVPPTSFPKFITADWIDLNKIQAISRFRSQEGHDYSDIYESQRSMKHYFDTYPQYGDANNTVAVFSPVDGVIVDAFYESNIVAGEPRGRQVVIKSDLAPSFQIHLFHTNLNPGIYIGMSVRAGQQLGFADLRTDANGTSNVDISVFWIIPALGVRLVSYFDVMSDSVFAHYQARGVATRDQMIIPQSVADQYVGFSENYTRDVQVLTPP